MVKSKLNNSDSFSLINQGINHKTVKHTFKRGKITKQQCCFRKKRISSSVTGWPVQTTRVCNQPAGCRSLLAILAQGLAQDLTLVKIDRQTHSKQAEPYLRAGDWERKREEMLRFSVLSRLLHEPPKNFG